MRRSLKVVIQLLIAVIFSASAYGQLEMTEPKSAYEMFLSDYGTMVTKDFYELTTLGTKHKIVEVKVVKLTSEKGSKCFLSLSAKAKYSEKTAVISEEDLAEISKALGVLSKKSKEEVVTKLEYRERYFATDDGFKVGYFQKNTDQTFFIDLDDHQSEDTYFLYSIGSFIVVIDNAKTMIEKIK